MNSVTDAVRGVADYGNGALGFVALAGMAWAGSSLFGALRKALNITFDDSESKRPFVPQKAIDLSLLLVLLVFFLASVGATAFLRIVRSNSSELGALGDAAADSGLLWDAASYAIPLVFSFIAFAALYCHRAQPRAVASCQVWPGALVAALAFEAAKLGFSFYLERFSNYDVVFGSLGGVAAFLFWIYVSAVYHALRRGGRLGISARAGGRLPAARHGGPKATRSNNAPGRPSAVCLSPPANRRPA